MRRKSNAQVKSSHVTSSEGRREKGKWSVIEMVLHLKIEKHFARNEAICHFLSEHQKLAGWVVNSRRSSGIHGRYYCLSRRVHVCWVLNVGLGFTKHRHKNKVTYRLYFVQKSWQSKIWQRPSMDRVTFGMLRLLNGLLSRLSISLRTQHVVTTCRECHLTK